jgi:hypothetical protein
VVNPSTTPPDSDTGVGDDQNTSNPDTNILGIGKRSFSLGQQSWWKSPRILIGTGAFAILSIGALYYYFHHYAKRAYC